MNSSKIINISTENEFNKEVLNSQEPVIVDFYADWCEPCKKLTPKLEDALSNQKCFKLAKVNVDNNKELSQNYKVSGIPHVILFFQGKQVMEIVGLHLKKLEEMIQKCKNLAKPKFSGTGFVIDQSSQNLQQDQDLPEEIFIEIISTLPPEPSDNDENSFNIIIKYNDTSLQRRFNADDSIEIIKLFVKCKLKTLREIELFEPFPRKIYTGNGQIKTSGISKNQILTVKLL